MTGERDETPVAFTADDARLAKLEAAIRVYDRLGGELARKIDALAARVDVLEKDDVMMPRDD